MKAELNTTVNGRQLKVTYGPGKTVTSPFTRLPDGNFVLTCSEEFLIDLVDLINRESAE